MFKQDQEKNIASRSSSLHEYRILVVVCSRVVQHYSSTHPSEIYRQIGRSSSLYTVPVHTIPLPLQCDSVNHPAVLGTLSLSNDLLHTTTTVQ